MDRVDAAARRLFARGEVVKICGIREPEHAAAAAAAGADLLGFIFASARRQISAATARACVAAARETAAGSNVLTVGVFVDAGDAEIAQTVLESGVDLVQLHGSEPPAFVGTLPTPAIKVLRPRRGASAASVVAEIDRFVTAAAPPLALAIDGHADHASGGSGVRADWELAAAVGAERPVLLAGGLDPENVGVAIRQVRPLGVDVSSGVETNGMKDAARIEAFIREARAAFRG